jgi:r-opsin
MIINLGFVIIFVTFAECLLYAFVQGYCALVSIWLITAISLTRLVNFYSGPVAASIYRRHFIIIALVIPLLATVPPGLGWSRYTPEGFLTTCSFDYITLTWSNRAFVAYLYVLGFALPCVLIAFSYVRIATALHWRKWVLYTVQKHSTIDETANYDDSAQSERITERPLPLVVMDANVASALITSEEEVPALTRSATTTDMNDSRREHAAMMTIVYVFGAYLLAWVPYALLGAFGQMGGTLFVTPYSAAAAGVLAKSSCAYNPIIYAMVDAEFRHEMKTLLYSVSSLLGFLRDA